jgi:hypothetical protein
VPICSDSSWVGLKTVAFVTTDAVDHGCCVEMKPDLLVTASSTDWQADDPMALPVVIMEYKAAGTPVSNTRDL